jgi:hypothetical protein
MGLISMKRQAFFMIDKLDIDSNTNIIHIKIESGISASHLKMILDKLQEINLECQITFASGAKIFLLPSKNFLRVEQTDL